jgi:hypothetical protein
MPRARGGVNQRLLGRPLQMPLLSSELCVELQRQPVRLRRVAPDAPNLFLQRVARSFLGLKTLHRHVCAVSAL